MSIKQFHIVFITASIILCLGTSWWFLFSDKADGSLLSLFFAISTLIIGIGLIGYEVYFIQKCRQLPNS